jgi:N-acetylmuramoyl-L-alanine amidase
MMGFRPPRPQRAPGTQRPRTAIVATLTLVSLVSFAAILRAEAEATPADMYFAAMDREQAVRIALADPGAGPTVASEVRAVVGAYQELVRRRPASGYCDDALWQAGRLALDAFARFGQERDRTIGIRLLRLLATEYPKSRRIKDIPDQIARVEQVVQPAATGKVATIREIRREVLVDAVRITIELDREVTFHDERIPDPVRVFLDLPSTRAAPALVDRTLRFDGDNDIVRQIRIGRHPNSTTRVVLDAAGISTYSVYPLYDPYRLVIDCVRRPAAVLPRSSIFAADIREGARPAAPPLLRAKPVVAAPVVVPPIASSPPVPVAVPAAPAPAPLPPLVSTDALPPLPAASAPPKNVGGGYSMARQLGLTVSRIVIDPGHGGHDPGAKGQSITEADLVLDIALRLEKLLQKVSGTDVILTRRTDDFVPLQERTAIANREGADLFLSIHANASANPSAHGIETYFLNFASNMTAASVAARENAASGQAMAALPDFLRAIALNNKLDESRDFATAVQGAMVNRLRKSNKAVKDLGVKQAPFVVLIGAAMPSVLAEISFVTNTAEARLLRGSAYRQRIAEALAEAVREYQMSLKNVGTVAHK